MTNPSQRPISASRHGTPRCSYCRIFTWRKTEIATSPFVFRGAAIFLPQKLGNLQQWVRLWTVGFSNPLAVETAPDDGTRRTKVFYARPYTATDKAHVERNHEYIRRIVFKTRSTRSAST